jgi:hypothetical protein
VTVSAYESVRIRLSPDLSLLDWAVNFRENQKKNSEVYDGQSAWLTRGFALMCATCKLLKILAERGGFGPCPAQALP